MGYDKQMNMLQNENGRGSPKFAVFFFRSLLQLASAQ